MKIISTNIAKPVTIERNGKKVQTGIYKKSVEKPIFLGFNGVLNDSVLDKKHHGGIDKACYIYSADKYSFWKKQFPELNWTWGMFGENLTIEGYYDDNTFIGDTFKVGSAIIQVSEPRRPCSILGVRFGTQQMVKLFNNANFPGTYARIIQEGELKTGDKLELIEQYSDVSVSNVFSLFSSEKKNIELAKKSIESEHLSQTIKDSIIKRFSL